MKERKDLIEKFQCPGCINGMDTTCKLYKFDETSGSCQSHLIGTQLGFGNPISLGLPKGFNKPGFSPDGQPYFSMRIRIWENGNKPVWDKFNIPVWAMEYKNFLFVRTIAPRINVMWVDIIENGTLDLCPQAVNVSEFYNEID